MDNAIKIDLDTYKEVRLDLVDTLLGHLPDSERPFHLTPFWVSGAFDNPTFTCDLTFEAKPRYFYHGFKVPGWATSAPKNVGTDLWQVRISKQLISEVAGQ